MIVNGGCLCSGVKFTYSGGVGPAGYCHCTDCRRCTGSAYTLSVRFAASNFEIERGNLGNFTKVGESGQALTRHFCKDCGSPIYTSSEGHPEFLFVKAGVIEDPSLVRPVREIWTRSRVPWAEIPHNMASFEKGGP